MSQYSTKNGKKNDKVQGGDGTKKHAEESSKIYALL